MNSDFILEVIIQIGRVLVATGAVALAIRIRYSMIRTHGGKAWGVLAILGAVSVAGYGGFIAIAKDFIPGLGFIVWVNLSTAAVYWGSVMHRYQAQRKLEDEGKAFLKEVYDKAKPSNTRSKVPEVRGAMIDHVVTVDDVEKAVAHILQFRK